MGKRVEAPFGKGGKTTPGFCVRVTDRHPGVHPFRRAGPASVLSRTPGVARISHLFGQDGPAILTELCFTDQAIQDMLTSGVLVATATPG